MTDMVMACIDGSDASPSVCDYATWVARRLNAPLTFLHVLDHSEYPLQSNLSGAIGLGAREALLEELTVLDEQRNKLALEQGKVMLAAAQEQAEAAGIAGTLTRQRHGHLVEALLDVEAETRVFVMGREGEHPAQHHVGSHVENVVRSVHRPILITVSDFRAPSAVMVAFDGSETMRKGMAMIAASPLLQGLPVHVVKVGDDKPACHEQLAWAHDVLQAAGLDVQTTLLQGEVETALAQFKKAHNIDFMVMGAYGHSRIRELLLGSMTTKMIRHADIPMLVLR
ncbi:universal stress protein [Salinispirillum marinum]|uniref:Universal stress protein n=2 Tax=Saccharospirillaceae TaxID=255527 RepID=A0ABV8BFA0_9GAMM